MKINQQAYFPKHKSPSFANFKKENKQNQNNEFAFSKEASNALKSQIQINFSSRSRKRKHSLCALGGFVEKSLREDKKQKAAKALVDFYNEKGAIEGLKENPQFKKIRSDINPKNYLLSARVDENKEFLIKENAIAYRNNNYFFEAKIIPESVGWQESKEDVYSADKFVKEICNMFDNNELDYCADALNSFYNSKGGLNGIKKMFGDSMKTCSYGKNYKYKNYAITEDGILFVGKNTLGVCLNNGKRIDAEFTRQTGKKFVYVQAKNHDGIKYKAFGSIAE